MANTEQILTIDTIFTSEEAAVAQTGLSGWSALVMAGYGFTGDAAFAGQQFQLEYGDAERPIITVLHDGTSIIASLVLSRRSEFGDTRAYGVHGIVVRPDHMGRGLGSKLYERAVQDNGIDIVVGSTKTPAAVAARARALARCDMRTFFGLREITGGEPINTTTLRGFLDTYLAHSSGEVDPDTSLIYKDTNVLLPDIPHVERLPEHIQRAFEPIIAAQKEVGDTKTATLPLLSIKSHLLI